MEDLAYKYTQLPTKRERERERTVYAQRFTRGRLQCDKAERAPAYEQVNRKVGLWC